MARSKEQYSVYPRYSSGSPAMVGRDLALKVAQDEVLDHAYAIEGRMGAAQQERAKELGLSGIAEKLVERRGKWEVTDLITKEVYTHTPEERRADVERRRAANAKRT